MMINCIIASFLLCFVESQSMQSSGLMPPHNPSAETPQDVYNMEDSI